jgi:hypothetical protein
MGIKHSAAEEPCGLPSRSLETGSGTQLPLSSVVRTEIYFSEILEWKEEKKTEVKIEEQMKSEWT